MATTATEMKTNYPLPTFHYRVEIDGMDPVAFSEVSGLNIEVKPITYKDGLSCIQGAKHMPGMSEAAKLTLKKGVITGDSQLYTWINSIRITTVEKKNITISLMDEKGEAPVVTWKVMNAFPVKMDAPSFNATSNEVAIESLELMADDVKVEYE
ncbi:MAG: phage tail protein [Desulfobacterales bacterium]|nr:phage tail protein [Desulfobacterales bacterium]